MAGLFHQIRRLACGVSRAVVFDPDRRPKFPTTTPRLRATEENNDPEPGKPPTSNFDSGPHWFQPGCFCITLRITHGITNSTCGDNVAVQLPRPSRQVIGDGELPVGNVGKRR